MIAACPTCGARYRIEPAKLRPEGARLRCSRCESVFRVRAPAQPAAASPRRSPQPAAATPRETPAPQATPPREAPPARQAVPPTASRPQRPAVPSEASFDRERLVLVAHPESENGKSIADALGSWGLQSILVHDGVEAILNIQRALPRVVVLDAALPKMFGFQVCELMKRNESLRSIHVVLVGAIHDQDRYRRPPGELYGADAYVERQNLPDALRPVLEGFGMVGSAAPSARAPQAPPVAPEPAAPVAREPDPEPTPAPAPAPAPEAAPSDPALAAEIEQADRLARIIVSDIVLYNPERFEAGVRSGDVVGALEAELQEGRTLFTQRVDPRVGPPERFLHAELVRVAKSRGMKG